MGDIRRPEDITRRRGKPSHDVTPKPIPRPITPRSIEDLLREMELLKAEIVKIKSALRAHGIPIQ